jgi:hypothetical protein
LFRTHARLPLVAQLGNAVRLPLHGLHVGSHARRFQASYIRLKQLEMQHLKSLGCCLLGFKPPPNFVFARNPTFLSPFELHLPSL